MYTTIQLYVFVSMHLCMYVSMFLCMYVCMFLCVYVCMYLSISLYRYIYLSISIYLHIYLHIYISIFTYLHIYIYIYIMFRRRTSRMHGHRRIFRRSCRMQHCKTMPWQWWVRLFDLGTQHDCTGTPTHQNIINRYAHTSVHTFDHLALSVEHQSH